jgi:hypothetical protein
MIRCIKFRRRHRNTLQGFADLELTRVGIIIRDCTWHRSGDGREWVGLPARSYQDEDGVERWQPIVGFARDAHQAREQFYELALEAIHAFVDEQEREAEAREAEAI